MSKIVVALGLLLSLNAFAKRQYIQCGIANRTNDTTGVVINLDSEKSTLYITNGIKKVSDIELTLKELKEIGEVDGQIKFETGKVKIRGLGNTKETLFIDKKNINLASQYLEVTMIRTNLDNGYELEVLLGCFSSIHGF